MFGDSILNSICTEINKRGKIEIENQCKIGETSKEALERIDEIMEKKPRTVVVGFGMNDLRKGIKCNEFKNNIMNIVSKLENKKINIIILTITPTLKLNKKVLEYNEKIKEIIEEKRLRAIDINKLIKEKFKISTFSLSPEIPMKKTIHLNSYAIKYLASIFEKILPREHTVIIWEYNGHEAKCNYNCPYCYYSYSPRAENYFIGNIEHWHKCFKKVFGNRDLIFYLTFGEPTLGEAFYDVIKMIESEPNWKVRITTNLSQPLERLVKTKIVKEGRLFINASFHPYSVTKEKFVEKLLFLRKYDVECPIIYVMYPPFFNRFFEDMDFFNHYNFVVHIRRFSGIYKGKYYPKAYTEEERKTIAKYSDTGTILYMLNHKPWFDRKTFSGYDFFIVGCTGDIGYDSDCYERYTKYRNIFGNLIEYDYVRLPEYPHRYPLGYNQGTVDGVSNMFEAGYSQLTGNNVLNFARQGGVYKDKTGVVNYNNKNIDFNNSRIRAKYWFPARNIRDKYYRFLEIVHVGIIKYIKIKIDRMKGLYHHYKRQERTLKEFISYKKGKTIKKKM